MKHPARYVESYHWHLDVTFREDQSHTIEKQAAFNQNILRKLALNVLKIFEAGNKKLSLRRTPFVKVVISNSCERRVRPQFYPGLFLTDRA